MANTKYTALIVDDDRAILKLAALALEDEDFKCTTVSNGVQATERLSAAVYDLVVVDLAMPLKHGHSVAVELLSLPHRPVVVIVTGLAEPRIAKDLMARGVDDVIAKPLNFAMFAAKMKSLVSRHKHALDQVDDQADSPGEPGPRPITIAELNQRLIGMSRILPLSCTAVDVYELTNDRDADITRITAALERDPALLADVLRLANSPRYNLGVGKVVDVERAVMMVGRARVGELALANHALGAITNTIIPWINASLLSRRSIAAGVSLELLAPHAEARVHGLLAAAIMYPLGRVILGSLYPAHYNAVSEHCRTSGCALSQAELQLFPETSASTLVRLLHSWDVPREICDSLSLIGHNYHQLESLPGLTRSRAELLKIAILVGELAAGQWDPWDVLEFPSQSVLDRLEIHDLASCIKETRADLESIERYQPHPSLSDHHHVAARPLPAPGAVSCHSLWKPAGQMVASVFASLGMTLVEDDSPLILNALGADLEAVKQYLATAPVAPALVLVDKANAAPIARREYQTLAFPCSYAQIRQTCHELLLGGATSGTTPFFPVEPAVVTH